MRRSLVWCCREEDELLAIAEDIAKGEFEMKSNVCPVCMAANPDNAHLIREYQEMRRAQYGVFGQNAAEAATMLADQLLARGITYIPNIFGDIPITR